MTQEEKAKAYDEALERTKLWVRGKYPGRFTTVEKVAEFIFPEPNESKDERIRKGIKSILEHHKESGEVVCPYPFVSIDEALTWLEKQGEKKTIIIPKFRVGDEIKTANEESLTITKIDERGYWSEDLFICSFDEECIWDLVKEQSVEPDWW